ncbi:ubiquitin-specific protease ubp2 [Onygenales sp. PD_12]|nr:ubiquitin-specific protease ubp2 [Onygenales sp. PD_12]
MDIPRRPGKTTPRFIEDLLYYDPANPPSSGFNLLTQISPVIYDANSHYPEIVSGRACPHRYVTKRNQTKLPPEGFQPAAKTVYRISAVCLLCRYHLQLKLTQENESSQCPSQLHHLVYTHSNTPNTSNPFSVKGQRQESHFFRCSYPQCSVSVSVQLLSPALSPEWVNILTSAELLKQRTDDALAALPERLEGLSRPFPISVLTNLRIYIEHALHESQRSKSISISNKRFVVCFGVAGEPCKDILEFIGFTRKGDFWDPPRANTGAPPPYEDDQNTFLDNVSSELLVLIHQRPEHELEGQPRGAPDNAIRKIHRLLGSLDYDTARFRGTENPNMERAPYYEDLGAKSDMSSALIIEAYRRQVTTDPIRAPYYLRCLRSIGRWRGDMDSLIQDAVDTEYQSGRYADDDIPNAYAYFGFDSRDSSTKDDDILEAFFYLLSNSPNKDMEMRRHLWRIGDSRKSEKIKSAAEERVSTVQQALLFLGAESNTSDDFIVSMYTAKLSDNPACKHIARKAIELIAEARKSEPLRYFLSTGELGATEMDAAEAFRLLQIPDRTVDDAAILAAFSVCCSEAPGQIESYRKALSIIAKEKQSALLSNSLADETTQTNRVLMEWPVGLQNIGNTCYLNSLLQFYFTIIPFCEMVVNFDDNIMPLDEESVAKKKIGSRHVSRSEIERSQKFLRELQGLFKNMISSPTPSVTPEHELARLTLISSSNEAAIRRRSLVSNARPGLGELHGMPIMGPLGPPSAPANSADNPMGEGALDEDSEITLVSLTADDKENLVPSVEDNLVEMTDVAPAQEVQTAHDKPSLEPISPPNRPPPVPPRPTAQADQKRLKEEVELGAQQDVTEVINNVLFQAQCAVRPLKLDQDGEQLDRITDVFYGRTKSHITDKSGIRSKEEIWSDIKVDVATGSKDIYAAIDGAFDVQKVEVDGSEVDQFGTISKLPPVLQIQVQRVQFDQVKKTSFKSTHHLDLKERIYMDRYMESPGNTEIQARRHECWQWKEELRKLAARKAELVNSENWEYLPDVFREAKAQVQYLMEFREWDHLRNEAIEVDDGILSRLTAVEDMVRDEIKNIEAQEKHLNSLIASQFADLRKLSYRLYAVFMHHGSVEFGHYYIYIYDIEQDIWRKYNDSEVTEVHNRAEIFDSPQMLNPPTPYFLVYINESLQHRLVKPVNRNIQVVVPPETPAEMVMATPQSNGLVDPETEDPPVVEVNMEDPPAYNDIVSIPMDAQDHKVMERETIDGKNTPASTNKAWDNKITNLPSVSW